MTEQTKEKTPEEISDEFIFHTKNCTLDQGGMENEYCSCRKSERKKALAEIIQSERDRHAEEKKALEYFIGSLRNYDGDEKRLLEETVFENRRLKAELLALNEKGYDMALENDRLTASLAAEADYFQRKIDRLTASLAVAYEALTQFRDQNLDVFASVDRPAVCKIIDNVRSDREGAKALERWRKMKKLVEVVLAWDKASITAENAIKFDMAIAKAVREYREALSDGKEKENGEV